MSNMEGREGARGQELRLKSSGKGEGHDWLGRTCINTHDRMRHKEGNM